MISLKRQDGGRRADAGFVLVVVLALCLTLALIGAIVARQIRSEIRDRAALTSVAEAEAAADAGVALVLADWMATAPENGAGARFVPGQGPTHCRFARAALSIDVASAAGKVPLNTDNAELLATLFAGLGAAPADARTYADRVIDWQDADTTPLPAGAERETYLSASASKTGQPPPPPRDANFEAVSEIDQVLGLPKPLVTAAKPWLTVYGTGDGIDPAAAAPRLVAILARGAARLGGFDSSAAEGQFSDGPALPDRLVARVLRPVLEITVSAELGPARRFVRTAAIEPTNEGLKLRDWAQGNGDAAGAAEGTDGGDLPACGI
ncbi:MAG: type II secretion system protein GspK [Hyphomicrobium sp.]|nr:type II secretion system protein GspK [Hyphomicrobium sp.]